MNDIVFPFKRYQMQPVWRGERTKRGRYKEFRQFDIDTIWRSETDVGVWYDAESVIVMYRALRDIFMTAGIDKTIMVKVSHIQIIKSLIASWEMDEIQSKHVFKTLDDWYKRSAEENSAMLAEVLDTTQTAFLTKVIDTKDLSLLSEYE